MSALSTTTCRSNQTAITNENGRLSQAETDHATQEIGKYRDEDEVDKTKIDAKTWIRKSLRYDAKHIHRRKAETEKAVHARNRLDKNRWREKHALKPKKRGPQCPQNARERAGLTNHRQVPTIQSVQNMVKVPKSAIH